MDKNKIIEVAYKAIKESTEWGMGCESKEYGNWIDGVITMADNLIEEIDMEEHKLLQNELVPVMD